MWSKMKTREAPVLGTKCKFLDGGLNIGGVVYLHVLEQLLRLSIIPAFDLLVVDKVFLA